MKSRDYKRQARATLSGNWGTAVLATLIYGVIYIVCSSPNAYMQLKADTFTPPFTTEVIKLVLGLSSATTLIYFFLMNPLSVGYANAFKKLHMEGDAELPENTFRLGFRNYAHNVLGMIHVGVLVLLWSLLLIIPGIVKYFSYGMTPYILVDHPEMSTREAIHESRRMMKGRKWKLFCLALSFLGWALLCIPTLGIGLLWLVPYMTTAQAAFYENILEEDKAARIAAAASMNSASGHEPVKLREFEESNHDDYAPKGDWDV